MAEVMAVESMVEAEWILEEGYWTKLRFPIQLANGSWSDIDVLSYQPQKKHLVISEVKVRGPKQWVGAYTEDTKRKHGNILEYDGNNYFSFIQHLPRCCEDGVLFGSFARWVKRLTFQLVSNYVIDKSLMPEAKQDVVDAIKMLPNMPPVKVDVVLESTLDVMARVIKKQRANKQGRRHGHPVLDVVRELNRYLEPTIRHAGKGGAKTDAVKKQALLPLWDALELGKPFAVVDNRLAK